MIAGRYLFSVRISRQQFKGDYSARITEPFWITCGSENYADVEKKTKHYIKEQKFIKPKIESIVKEGKIAA
jgi:hypothetical protein